MVHEKVGEMEEACHIFGLVLGFHSLKFVQASQTQLEMVNV